VGTYVGREWSGHPSGATRAERRPCSYRAYVPDLLLGAEITIPSALAADLTDVEQQIRRLNVTHPGLVNPEPLARFLLRAEAVASSHIEGLVINVRRLARGEAAEREGLPATDHTAQAVLGNMRALDEALSVEADPSVPVTVDSILRIHTALLSGGRDQQWAGVVRTEQNWVGGPNPCRAAFVPPPADKVPELLEDLAAYLSRADDPALLQAALAHSQFETIHPFADGNGRTGRALILLVLRRRGLALGAIPPVSLVLATQSDRYIQALDGTRQPGPTQQPQLAWVELFLSATARACQEAGRFADDLAALDGQWREQLGQVRARSAADLLVGVLPALPVFSVRTAAAHIGRSYQATSDAVDRLERAGVVRQVTIGRRNRAFEAVGLFEAFTGFERVLASPDGDTRISLPARQVPPRQPKSGRARRSPVGTD
jgi:Fic family protein